MPNIKSAKKRVLVTAKKTARNKSIKSGVKTEIKKFIALVESGDKKAATALFLVGNRLCCFQGCS